MKSQPHLHYANPNIQVCVRKIRVKCLQLGSLAIHVTYLSHLSSSWRACKHLHSIQDILNMQIGKERERHSEDPRLAGARGKPTTPNCDGIWPQGCGIQANDKFFPNDVSFLLEPWRKEETLTTHRGSFWAFVKVFSSLAREAFEEERACIGSIAQFVVRFSWHKS